MKRFMILAVAALIAAVSAEAKRVPATVQGVSYGETLKKGQRQKIVPAWEWDPNPDAPALPENEFTFDDIQSWTGEGENRAALVIQWNDPRETHAVVFGYRWDGLATGADMIRAVVANNPRLYGLIQYTNVSSPTDPLGGYTINGFGWDADSDGEIELWDSENDDYYTVPDGLFIHPRGYDPDKGGSSDYDYDNWKAVDNDDFWQAGWYIGYWSYWVKDSVDANFSYSGWGASGRVLENGSWDGWNYAVDMMASDWKEFKAAPSSIPEGAKTEFEVDGLYFSLTDYQTGKVKLVNPSALTTIENPAAYTGEIVVPAEFIDDEKTYTVTEIDAEAFKGASVTTVVLPASVKKIGAYAFAGSTLSEIKGAEGVEISETVTSLGSYAFEGCKEIKDLYLPVALTAIPEGLYKGCGLKEISLPAGITAIGASAFEDNLQLVSLDIPESVIKIEDKAFAGCNALENIKVNTVYPPEISETTFSETAYAEATLQIPTGFDKEYKAKEGWTNFNKIEFFNVAVADGDIFSTDNVTYKVAIEEENEYVAVTYPKIDGKPTRDNIKEANKKLEGAIIIPASVNYMGHDYKVAEMRDSAFYGASNVTSIIINAQIESIPNQAFTDCDKLAEVKLPESLKSIGEYAFSYAGIESLQIPDGVETLGSHAFFQCQKLTAVNVPGALKVVPDYCFSYCKSLESLAFGNQVEKIDQRAMQNCSALTEVKLPENLEAISDYMFSNCSSLENLVIPESVKSIGSSAFSSCSSLTVALPSSLETIGASALSGVANETIVIPETITELPNSLFSGNKTLKNVIVSDNITSFGNYLFQNCSELTTISVLKGEAEIETLSEETGLSFPSKLVSLGNSCFQGCNAIQSAVVPEGVTNVGQNLFNKCANLEEVILPNSVTLLQSGMFQECKKLTKLTLGNAITSIPQNFVRDCTELEWILVSGNEEDAVAGRMELPETVTTIASWTFANCKKLTEVIIPSKVTSLEMNTFDGCSSLAKVSLPDGLTKIGNYVFRNTALTELELPASVNSMNYTNDIVNGCTDITVYVCSSEDPITIGANAFRVATGVYAPVMVPLGKKEAYENANNWKQSAISEAVPVMTIEGEESEADDPKKAGISVELTLDFEEELPVRFREANEEALMNEAEFELHWRNGEEIASDQPSLLALAEDSSEEEGTPEEEMPEEAKFEKASVEFNSEGKAVATIERPAKDTMVEAKLHASHASGEYESAVVAIPVKGTGVETGIEEIGIYPDASESYYDLNGLKVANPEKGIYIRVKNGKVEKKNL